MAGTTINPYRFGSQAGYRRDAPMRQYVRARHLDTTQGRWASRDPLGLGGGDDNLYRYVASGPAINVDPTGMAIKGLGECPRSEHCHRCDRIGRTPSVDWHPEWDRVILAAMDKYCTRTCPHLKLDNFLCQIFAESDGDPRNRYAENRGLFQISPDVWRLYGCQAFGPYFPSVWDPVKNIQCAIKAMCRKGPGGFHCKQTKQEHGWGTDGTRGQKLECCNQCNYWQYADPGDPRRASA